MKAIVYAAKSTVDVHGSIGTQLADGRALAAERGWTVADEFTDEKKSAYHGDRGDGLTKAMALCEELSPCALVVQHSDRLARGDGKQARHLIEIVLWGLKHGVELVSKQDPEMLSGGDYALLMGAIGGMRNHQDSKRKGQSVSDGLKRRAAQGQSRGGPRPYGYQRAYRMDKRGKTESYYRLDRTEAAVVRRIFADYLAGASVRDLATALLKEKVPAPNGGKWGQTSVRRILSRKLYIGVVTDADGNEHPGEHEAIIDRETLDRAAVLMASRSRKRNVARLSRGSHLLTAGILRCGRCGNAMNPRANLSRNTEWYICAGRINWGAEVCDMPSVRREVIDGALMKDLNTRYVDLEESRRQLEERTLATTALARQAVTEAGAEVAKAEARLQRVKRAFQDGYLDPADYASQRAQLTTEHDGAASALLRAEAHAAEVAASTDGNDAEDALLARLAALRAGVADATGRAADLKALRTIISDLFDHVRYFTSEHPLIGIEFVRKSGQPLPAGAYLVPFLSPDAIVAWDGERPIVRKVALPVETGVLEGRTGSSPASSG